jgi:beta-N-acetylhexosaminidase
MRSLLIPILAALLALAGWRQPEPSPGGPAADELWPGTGAWARSVIDTLSLEAKVAQLFVTHVGGRDGYTPEDLERVADRVARFGAGGVTFFSGDADRQRDLTLHLQSLARIPLLISQDMEHGVGMRVRGATSYPRAMALGATADLELTYRMARALADEARQMGIHQNYAPVADLNNNPDNPIINVRSFGEDPEAVSAMVEAYVRGIQDGGLIATVKHFPGHGDTNVDSHAALPVLRFDRERLDEFELAPFRRAIEAGVKSVMVGHLDVPELDELPGAPATMSPAAVTRVLRRELGFDGLIVTDGLDMDGIADMYEIGDAAVLALEAGADLLLLARDEYVARDSILAAIRRGRISEARIDSSLMRVLRAKEWLGLHEAAPQAPLVGPPFLFCNNTHLAEEIASRSLTLLRNDPAILPLAHGRRLMVLALEDGTPAGDGPFVEELGARSRQILHRRLSTASRAAEIDSLVALAALYDAVILPTFVRVRAGTGYIGLPNAHRSTIERLVAGPTPVVLVSFGNPYVAMGLTEPAVYMAAYDGSDAMQRVTAQALFGERAVSGRLPVTLPGLYPLGSGLDLQQTSLLRQPHPSPMLAARMDSLMDAAIAGRVFPGAAIAVGTPRGLLLARGYGHYTYERRRPVDTASEYDLASVTKAVGTTLALMKLYEDGLVDLDATVATYVPEFERKGKQDVIVRQVLAHSGGMRVHKAFASTDFRSHEDVLASIYSDSLQYDPGTDTRYSDLGFILLGEVVERITGRGLDAYLAETFYEPLGMTRTGFRSVGLADTSVVPTELDAAFRGRLVQGEVHDETAWLMAGVAGHAGLFSTAEDLARLAQMLAAGGQAFGQRFLRPETIALFTRRVSPRGEYPMALGWMAWRPESEGYSSAGPLMGSRSFGHTGFTGTSLWIDPDSGLYVILLTNRVHPTRDNNRLAPVRPAVASVAARSITEARRPCP